MGSSGVFTYSLAPDVPGLTFDTSTRQLSGIASSVGEYQMTYTATDAAPEMGTTTLMFTIVVSPPAVSNFEATLSEDSARVKLIWNAIAGVSGYDIERWSRSERDATFSLDTSFGHGGAQTAKAHETEYTDNGVVAGSEYFYRISAYLTLVSNELRRGEWVESEDIYIELPPTPTPTPTETPTPTPLPTPNVYTNAHGDTHRYTYPNTVAHSHTHSDSYSNAHGCFHSNTDSYANSNTYGYFHPNFN